jgi:hypothetical protein
MFTPKEEQVTVFDQIARPLSWLHARNSPSATDVRKAIAETAAPATIHHSALPAQQVQLIGKGIKLPRRLDASCYQEVLAAVQQVYPYSGPVLVLDLSDVEQLELTGIFALHCVGLMIRGETTPDPANGWKAMRAAVERNLAAGRQSNLKLVNPSARIEALLRANHFDRCLVIESVI